MRVFYFVHDEGGQDASDGVDGSEDVDDKLVIVFHVRRVDFQQVIVFSRDVVAFGHLGNVPDDGDEFLRHFPVHLLELHRAEYDEAQVEFVRIQDGDVFPDETAPFQAFEPFENGRGGKVDPGGQFLRGQAGILLEVPQDVEVDGIEYDVVHGTE